MKNMKKLLSVIVAIFLIATMALPTSAATQSYTGTAGSIVNVYFTYDGLFSFDTPEPLSCYDPAGIVGGVTYTIADNGGLTGTIQNNKIFLFDASNSDVGHKVVICATVSLKSTAPVGSKCSVQIKYNLTTDPTAVDIISGAETSEIVVVQGGSTTPSQPAQPSKPAEPSVKIDYSKLNEQIKAADALDGELYSASSWTALEEALANARGMTSSKSQDSVDKAAEALKNAIAALVELDYTKLEEAIAAANSFLKDNITDDKLDVFVNAFNAAQATLESKEQTDIDAAADALTNALAELMDALDDFVGVSPMNPLPDYDYCNIRLHKIYQMIMWISILLNLVLIAFIVYIFAKKRNRRYR